MSFDLLAHASAIFALLLNATALCCRCEVALRRHSVVAGFPCALNNLLIGANSAAALSAVGAGYGALRCRRPASVS